MRVGLICPYSFEAPGGVQFHIRDLAEFLNRHGHVAQVLAPAETGAELAPYMTSVGPAVPIRYNGSVARLSMGPAVVSRTKRWLAAGNFDVIHIHEPFAPSVGMIAMRHATVPVVATFHSSQQRSRALQLVSPLLQTALERISARIAVSEDARRTVIEHLGGDAVVIPNGVDTNFFASANANPSWTGTGEAPTIAFLGRLDEPRKGLGVLAASLAKLRQRFPGLRVLVAGSGDLTPARQIAGVHAGALEALGRISDDEKATLLSSVDAYIAPQTGGESFGIVLVEAMSAGTTVIASDISAFQRVLDDGRSGYLFENGDSDSLATTIIQALTDAKTTGDKREWAATAVKRFDWASVARKILDVYGVVTQTSAEIAQQGSGA